MKTIACKGCGKPIFHLPYNGTVKFFDEFRYATFFLSDWTDLQVQTSVVLVHSEHSCERYEMGVLKPKKERK